MEIPDPASKAVLVKVIGFILFNFLHHHNISFTLAQQLSCSVRRHLGLSLVSVIRIQ